MKKNMFKIFLLIFCDFYQLSLSLTKNTTSIFTLKDNKNDTLRLAIGSMLNITCNVNENCILKNSFCSQITKRCECDTQTMESNSVCQVIYCSSSIECQQRYPNTLCNYGHCQCQYGIKANGQCITASISGESNASANQSLNEIISKLPPWSFPVILVGSVLFGALGSRSPLFSQIFQHILAIIVLIVRALKRVSTTEATIPAEVVAKVVDELVEIPLERKTRSSSSKSSDKSTFNNKRTSTTSGGVVESCHHVHEIQLNCDAEDSNV